MIGRIEETKALDHAMASNQSEMIALIGRRRIGKTYLVRQYFGERLDFEMVGLKDGNQEQQLRNFAYSLKDARNSESLENPPKDWLEAFNRLKEFLESIKVDDRKKIVFIDELPWLATAKSDFLTGFSYFWNSYASKNKIVVIICGSAASWMIKKVINNRGGLHNRVTKKLLLKPFSLTEVENYFIARNIHFERYQLVQLYMALGGIPHYLDQVEGGKSAVQNINAICFKVNGLLRTEFENLFSSLFTHPERYENIIAALATKWKGMTRTEIVEFTKEKDGGGLTSRLKELEQSGFINSYASFNKKKKNALFRLTDNYSLFYMKYIKNLQKNEESNWQSLSQMQSWKTWSGYAFENICLQHIDKIKIALGISGIYTKESSFYTKSSDSEEGTQIDLLIDRNDNAISLCEIKFYNELIQLTKKQAAELRSRKSIFRRITKSKKQLFIVLISTYGIVPNQYSIGLIDNTIDMNALF